MKATNLTSGELVKTLHSITSKFDRFVQLDTLLDVADLLETAYLYSYPPCGFFRFWGLRSSGTVMARVNDFDEWEPQIVARYRISFDGCSSWCIEQL